jgi:pseudouridine synthase
LQKYLAECGVASRRGSEKIVADGRVHVNGEVGQLGQSVDPEVDAITLDGAALRPDHKIYILLNKPKGVITSAKDTHDRATVLDCLKDVKARVYPVGRLDMDTEGVLLLTNDGELAFRLTHPQFEVEKVYLACVVGKVEEATADRLAKGIELEDGMTAPAKVKIIRHDRATTLLRITLREGKKREVKRMCMAVGHGVRDLQRIAFGSLGVKGMRPGEWRYLREAELIDLRTAAGLDA